MKITDQAIEDVISSVEASDDGLLIATGQEFWTHFGAEDLMAQAQQEITERLADHGLEVTFEVVVTWTPSELPEFTEFALPPAPVPLDLDVPTLRALSIQQPWVERILTGQKNIEYRSYQIREMGPLLLHASRTLKPENFEGLDTPPEDLPYGAVVGIVDVIAVQPVEGEEKLYAWHLAHPRRFRTPLPFKGAAGIFRVPSEVVAAALRRTMYGRP
jgi:hypothetical protein